MWGRILLPLLLFVLYIQFTDPTAARRLPGGVLVVEYLYTRGYDTWPVLTADQLTIVGPGRTTVTNSPPGARVDGRNATWNSNASVPLYEVPTVQSDSYVAFAESDLTIDLWTGLAIALATAPIVSAVLWGTHLPPLLVLTIGLLANFEIYPSRSGTTGSPTTGLSE